MSATDPVSFAASEADAVVLTRRRFWRAQVIGWPIFGFLYFLLVLPFQRDVALMLFEFKMIWAVTGLLVTSLLALFYRRIRLLDRSIAIAVTAAALISAATAIPWVIALGRMADAIWKGDLIIFGRSSFPLVASIHVFILIAWSLAWLSVLYARQSQAEARKALAATALARDAQLRMLRYQLDPHFLFNALASLRALIGVDAERARETVTLLSEFLRYTLGRDGHEATVAQELAMVRDYLAIEKIRFEERLEVEIDGDAAVMDERIPAFLLHPLVENAIRHGSEQDRRLVIRVRARATETGTTLEVENSGVLQSAGNGTDAGIGVKNVRQRLAAAFPGRHAFSLTSGDGMVRAAITIRAVPG